MVAHIILRPELLQFATHCELVLRDNDHKHGWDSMSLGGILQRISDELEEMNIALSRTNPFDQLREISDVANFLMFLFHHVGRDLTVDCDCGCFSTSAYPQFD